MSSITDLQHRIANTTSRLSSFFIEDKAANDPTFHNFGRVEEGSLEADPMTSDQDQDGRQSTQLIEIEVSFAMQQAANKELEVIPDLAQPQGTGFENGHNIYVSGSKTTASEVADHFNDPDEGDPEGIYFKNVLPVVSPSLDLAGEVGLIEVSFTGIVELSEFDSLTENKTIYLSTT